MTTADAVRQADSLGPIFFARPWTLFSSLATSYFPFFSLCTVRFLLLFYLRLSSHIITLVVIPFSDIFSNISHFWLDRLNPAIGGSNRIGSAGRRVILSNKHVLWRELRVSAELYGSRWRTKGFTW
jgi:hypothetical protein